MADEAQREFVRGAYGDAVQVLTYIDGAQTCQVVPLKAFTALAERHGTACALLGRASFTNGRDAVTARELAEDAIS